MRVGWLVGWRVGSMAVNTDMLYISITFTLQIDIINNNHQCILEQAGGDGIG